MNRFSDVTNVGNNSGYGGDRRSGAGGMPNINLGQIPASFLRQLPWMLVLLPIMIFVSYMMTKDIKRKYMADASIFAQAGAEHIYNPVTGSTRSGVNITADQITLTEAAFIKNPATVDKVIYQMFAMDEAGETKGDGFAPKLYDKWKQAPDYKRADRWNDIVKLVNMSFTVTPVAKSSIINLEYKHVDGEIAVKTLTAFIGAYLELRNEIFVSEASGLIGEQLVLAEDQLSAIDKKIQSILNKNGIAEFETERLGSQKHSQLLRTQLDALRGNIARVEAALAVTEDQLRNTEPTIDLQITDRASQRLAQAELERRQLLAKYLPTSNVVRNKEAEISEIREQISDNGGRAVGGRRVGPNTVYQALATVRNTHQATADSLREQEIVLHAQLKTSNAKVKSMRVLGPKYQNLLREKTTLEERVKGLNAKEQSAFAKKEQQDAHADNIKVISYPTRARKGRNMQKISFALAILFSLFTVFMFALLRVFLDPKIYGSGKRGRAPLPSADENASYEDVYAQQVYAQNIPEPVPGYTEPQPAYAPAAASEYGQEYGTQEYTAQSYADQSYADQSYADQSYTENSTGYDAQTYSEQSYDAQAYATYGAQAHAEPQPYGTHDAQSYNPYAAKAENIAQEYVSQEYVGQEYVGQEYAGVDQTIPVLGTTEYSPPAPGAKAG